MVDAVEVEGAFEIVLEVAAEVAAAAAEDAAEVVPAAAAEVVPAAAAVEPVEEDERYEGAATAVEGSTSAPVPHSMVVPSVVVELVGAVELPSAAAMVKRVVQVRFEGNAEVENW